jgi:hypothetical protein
VEVREALAGAGQSSPNYADTQVVVDRISRQLYVAHMEISLEQLVSSVEAIGDRPLDHIAEAAATARHLGDVGDMLVDHFVEAGRSSGASWADIGDRLGVSRQAVQRRFTSQQVTDARPLQTPSPHRGRQEHHGKYRPLWKWLGDQRVDEVATSFEEIERILGFSLPPSCRRHQPHWHSYEGSAVVRAIVDAGWRASGVNIERERVTFVRAN